MALYRRRIKSITRTSLNQGFGTAKARRTPGRQNIPQGLKPKRTAARLPCSIKTRFQCFLSVLGAFAVNFLLILVAIAFPITEAHAAEFNLHPGITVSEEYNDNIFLATTDRVDDFVTRAMPSLNLHYRTELWNWDVNYSYDYRYYAERSREDDTTQSADVRNRTELLKNFFFVEMSDVYSRVSLDVTRDFANESEFLNQSDRNVFTLNPFVTLRSDSRSTAMLGYQYINTWYEDPTAIDTVDNIGYAEVTTPLSSRATLTAGARFTRQESNVLIFDKTDVYAGPRYTYARNSHIHFTAGNSWFNFGEGRNATQAFWSAGITHQYSTFTASIETGLSFITDPLRVLRREDRYVASIRKETERTALTVSAGAFDYRDPETKHLENTTYRVGGTMRYALTLRTSIFLDLAEERHKEYQTYTDQDLLLSGVRLEHRTTEHLTLSLQYRYTDSYAPDTFELNYYNNRALFEIAGTF